ncbi:MAG: hypothetical protein U0Y82_01520 [Thermoleophilia bacterium]
MAGHRRGGGASPGWECRRTPSTWPPPARPSACDDEEARLARVACFGGFSPFEVVGADGRKLVGLAQVRRRTGTLFQCGIAMDMDVQTLAQVLSSDPQAAARRATALDAITTGVHGTAPGLTTESVMREVEAVLMSRDDIRIG